MYTILLTGRPPVIKDHTGNNTGSGYHPEPVDGLLQIHYVVCGIGASRVLSTSGLGDQQLKLSDLTTTYSVVRCKSLHPHRPTTLYITNAVAMLAY